jgi:hypothetical protein
MVRQAVERIEARLASAPSKTVPKPRQAPLSEAGCKTLYGEILAEYKEGRATKKLDMLLTRPKGEISRFCAINNLPVELRNGKSGIREQILARIREDEQLGAIYPMPTPSPAYIAERKQ